MGDVDAYLRDQPAAERAALEHLCALVLEVAPEAEQGTSYGAPTFRHGGRPLFGFKAAKEHLSFFVFDPEINARVRDRLSGFRVTKGLVAFTPDAMPPDDVVRDMVRHRLAAPELLMGRTSWGDLDVLLVPDPDLLRPRH